MPQINLPVSEPLKERWDKLISDKNIDLENDLGEVFESIVPRLEWVAQVRASKQHLDETGLHLTQEELRQWHEESKSGKVVPLPEAHTWFYMINQPRTFKGAGLFLCPKNILAKYLFLLIFLCTNKSIMVVWK